MPIIEGSDPFIVGSNVRRNSRQDFLQSQWYPFLFKSSKKNISGAKSVSASMLYAANSSTEELRGLITNGDGIVSVDG